MQSETQQYDITVGAKEQRQQSLCSDKMVSSPGAIAEPIVWSNYAKSCLCIESLFIIPSYTSLWIHYCNVFCMSMLFEKFILQNVHFELKLHVHFLFHLPTTPYPTLTCPSFYYNFYLKWAINSLVSNCECYFWRSRLMRLQKCSYNIIIMIKNQIKPKIYYHLKND